MASIEDIIRRHLGRRVGQNELAAKLGISKATYARRKAEGPSADDVIQLARLYGMSPTEALVQAQILDEADVTRFVQNYGINGLTDEDILSELLGRAAVRKQKFGPQAVEGPGWGADTYYDLKTGGPRPIDDFSEGEASDDDGDDNPMTQNLSGPP